MSAEAQKAPVTTSLAAPRPRASASKGRGPLVHLGVLALAVAAAVSVWTRDKEPKALMSGDVTVWSGRSGDVDRFTFEAKDTKAVFEAKKDKLGRYFVGTIDKDTVAPSPPKEPHGDGEGDEHEGEAAANKDAPKVHATTTVVAVTAADKFAEAFAPLKALRALGKIGDDRAAEFGFDKPEGTVTIRVSGAEKKLLVGGTTPGGADRYVKDLGSGEVYAVRGEPLRNLEEAESLMMDRELHDWQDADVDSAMLQAGEKTRGILRGGSEGKTFWADAARPGENDETLGNWLLKLDRLRPMEFKQDVPGAELVVRVVYRKGSRDMGFVELDKAKGSGDKPDYFIKTERTRLFAKVATSLAEQVEQDVNSAVK
jgi:Domain of unknown function (DUF4340)